MDLKQRSEMTLVLNNISDKVYKGLDDRGFFPFIHTLRRQVTVGNVPQDIADQAEVIALDTLKNSNSKRVNGEARNAFDALTKGTGYGDLSIAGCGLKVATERAYEYIEALVPYNISHRLKQSTQEIM